MRFRNTARQSALGMEHLESRDLLATVSLLDDVALVTRMPKTMCAWGA